MIRSEVVHLVVGIIGDDGRIRVKKRIEKGCFKEYQ